MFRCHPYFFWSLNTHLHLSVCWFLINLLMCVCAWSVMGISEDNFLESVFPSIFTWVPKLKVSRHAVKCSKPLNHLTSSGHYSRLEWDTQGLQLLIWTLWRSGTVCASYGTGHTYFCHSCVLGAVRLSFGRCIKDNRHARVHPNFLFIQVCHVLTSIPSLFAQVSLLMFRENQGLSASLMMLHALRRSSFTVFVHFNEIVLALYLTQIMLRNPVSLDG